MSVNTCGECITRASCSGVIGLLLQKVNIQESCTKFMCNFNTDINDLNTYTMLYDKSIKNWVPSTLSLNQLKDVNVSLPSNGDMLTWNSLTLKWESTACSNVINCNSLSTLPISCHSDVEYITNPSFNGEYLRWDTTNGKFINQSTPVILGKYISTPLPTSGVIIGDSNTVSGLNNVVIGRSIEIDKSNTVAIGVNALANVSSVSIGNNSHASGPISVSIGLNTEATTFSSVSVGHDSVASGNRSITIGNNNTASGHQSIVIGTSATPPTLGTSSSGDNSLVINTTTQKVENTGDNSLIINRDDNNPYTNNDTDAIVIRPPATNITGSSAWATPRLPPAGYSFLVMDADGVIKRWDGSI